jgi:hypothetical protein
MQDGQEITWKPEGINEDHKNKAIIFNIPCFGGGPGGIAYNTGSAIFANRQAYDLLNFPLEKSAVGVSCFDFYEDPFHWDFLIKQFMGGQIINKERIQLRKYDGVTSPCRVSLLPFPGKKDRHIILMD